MTVPAPWTRNGPRSLLLLSMALISGILVPRDLVAQPLDMDLFKGMKARAIGPAGMSGRVTSIDVVESNKDVIYVGTASGGLWRSVNGGTSFSPILDMENAPSIGAVAINQSNPDLIWVGTGEGNPRNSQTGGTGMYRSINGGHSWQFLGLEDSRSIHRILLHPDDPDVAWIGVQGPAWGETEQRGVFRTTDGGTTWEKVLYVNERTGIADLVLDPSNPNKLIAAMWEFRRWPWFFKSGGAGSGLYVTHDGGSTWEKRTSNDGLPKGELGRIGLAIAPSNPHVVYAIVESEQNAVYRSEDGGWKWTKRSDDKDPRSRPFYYADIFVDSHNENRLYHIFTDISRSEDGGKTFEKIVQYTGDDMHPDHHAWWIDPDNPDFMINGNDGGMNITHDRGRTWRFVENLPLAQFYHIRVDDDLPYNVYGGMQDNGSWKGPAYVWRHGGIRNSYWQELNFGDGFDVIPDPDDGRYGYAMSQGGYLNRYDELTGEHRFIRPAVSDSARLRFNWNAGIAIDPFDHSIYYGSQFLHKSSDHGESWKTLSPDLTTNDPTKQRQSESGGLTYDVTAAENFTAIVSIAPSPVEPGVIWVGTDDGNVQLTRDAGISWTNLADRLPAAPDTGWVTQITPSTYDAGSAMVVIDNHRQNDWTPYVYRTSDFGATWERLVEPHDVDGYALSIVQDPVEPRLLFLGTELGLYVSIDGGIGWTKWTSGFPAVSTMDLAIQQQAGDLVMGTFGRSAFVLDDIAPLRALAAGGLAVFDSTIHVFEPPDAYQVSWGRATGSRFAADAHFEGENKPRGAQLTYSVLPVIATDSTRAPGAVVTTDSSDTTGDRVQIDVFNASSTLIRSFRGSALKGVNRAYWDLRSRGSRSPRTKLPDPDTLETVGTFVSPGVYSVTITYMELTDSTVVVVHPDPRIPYSTTDEEARQTAYSDWQHYVETATTAADRIRDAQTAIMRVDELAKRRDDDAAADVRKDGEAMADSLKLLLELFAGPEVQGIGGGAHTIAARLDEAASYLGVVGRPPGEGYEIALSHATDDLNAALENVNAFFAGDWNTYRMKVEDAQLSLFGDYDPILIHQDR